MVCCVFIMKADLDMNFFHSNTRMVVIHNTLDGNICVPLDNTQHFKHALQNILLKFIFENLYY
jgi:hypothetical protein